MPKTTAKRQTDLIIGRGLITAETVAQELRRRLADRLGELYRYLPSITLLAEARKILATFEPMLAETMAAGDLAGFIAGFDDVAERLPRHIEEQFGRMIGLPPRQPPGGSGLILPPGFGGSGEGEPMVRFPLIERAAKSLLERNILTREQFDRAGAAAKAKAFTVAGDLGRDTIETIRDVLSETIDRGASLEEFRRAIGPQLETSFAGPGHLETVFRTNINTAFHSGMSDLTDHPIVAEVLPYMRYDAIRDARARETHLALETLGIDGTNVYRRDDQFWDVFMPSWDFNCRCSATAITIQAAARRGVSEAQEWLRTGQRPPLVSRLPKIPFRPPAGFVGGRRRVAA